MKDLVLRSLINENSSFAHHVGLHNKTHSRFGEEVRLRCEFTSVGGFQLESEQLKSSKTQNSIQLIVLPLCATNAVSQVIGCSC